MALSDEQLEVVREIVGYWTLATVTANCADLAPAAEAAMGEDVEKWEAVRDSHFRMSGGADGVDMDSGRRGRQAIRKRVLERLGETAPSTGGLFRIPIGTAYPDYC